MSGNTAYHNTIKIILLALLLPIIRERRLGTLFSEQEYDFNGNAHGPDLSFFGPAAGAKQGLLDLSKRVQRFVPDLAIEIASPNDTWTSLVRRKARYRACGTEEVWILSPEDREVLIYSTRGDRILRGDAELSSELLPGFHVPVSRLFETSVQ